MNIDNTKIKDILLNGNYVTEEDIKRADDFCNTHHIPITEYLLSKGLITKDLLGQAIAESFGIPYASLHSHQPVLEQIMKIPENIAHQLRIVLFSEDEKTITIATDNPKQQEIISELKNIFKNKKIQLAYALSEDIDVIFLHYRKALNIRFEHIIKNQQKIAPEIIDEIFKDAICLGASDIHFEPQEKEVLIRFRIDGVLQEAGNIPKEHYENIVNKIKVQSHLRIDQHFSAQDGAIRYVYQDKAIDMRISIIPILNGEKITIRLLSHYVRSFTLNDLGLSAKDQNLISQASKKPFGMILVTGPTGSGKTTTLYALLKMLNRPEINITTIEDPAEYKMAGVNQIQVNTTTNLTFAKGLRSIVRQDPDIVLVGEIRDQETAEIAVNTALTGHLLLSTFHANDAATSIPRLLDMGIEPFLLSSTLEVVIAQRLARKICENCRYSISETQEYLEKKLGKNKKYYFSEKATTLYKGKGCENCGHSGYKGRIALFEFINVTPQIENLILKNPASQEIWDIAQKQGSLSLFEDGIEKVKNGITTMDELLRVASPPSYIHS